MTNAADLPILFTFDGQARSGKGTIVHAVKRSLQDLGIETMLIDAGQVLRVLAVSANQHGIDLEDTDALDRFLDNETMLQDTTELIKQVYHMEHAERDALLYTLEIGANSAKIAARSKSQDFKDGLLRKWLHDAREEGYKVVLLDGRALEEVGTMLEDAGLCEHRIGFYFICNPVTGARRTLGYADRPYDALTDSERTAVEQLVEQIIARNSSDATRKVHPVIPPEGAPLYLLPHFDFVPGASKKREMLIVDTSEEMTKEQMTESIVGLFERIYAK
jgi:cytidylate kinase